MPLPPPAEPDPHPVPPPRPWECDHCHTTIGHLVREGDCDVLYYRVYLWPGMFVTRPVARRSALPCPYCGEFTDWFPAPAVPHYDAEKIERMLSE